MGQTHVPCNPDAAVAVGGCAGGSSWVPARKTWPHLHYPPDSHGSVATAASPWRKPRTLAQCETSWVSCATKQLLIATKVWHCLLHGHGHWLQLRDTALQLHWLHGGLQLHALHPGNEGRRCRLSRTALGAPTKACICIGAGPVMPIPNAIPWGASEPLGRVRHSTSDPRHHHRHRHELHGAAAGSTQPLEPCAPGMHPRHVMRRLYPSTTARGGCCMGLSFTASEHVCTQPTLHSTSRTNPNIGPARFSKEFWRLARSRRSWVPSVARHRMA